MKAEDTVIDNKKLLQFELDAGYDTVRCEDVEVDRKIAKAQAEITAPIFFERGRQAGIKEVDRVLTNNYIFGGIVQSIHISLDDWQSKLKEWGIE